MIGGLGFFVTLWLGGFWQGWQWNNPSIPFIDTVVALKPVWTGALLLRHPDLLRDRRCSSTTSWPPCWEAASRSRSRRLRKQKEMHVRKADTKRLGFVVAALVLFFIGGIADHRGSAAGRQELEQAVRESRSHPKAPPASCGRTPTQELKGPRHLRPRRLLVLPHAADPHAAGRHQALAAGRACDSPISTPDEFVYDSPHMFGTKRTGPDLSRVGGKYDTQWHRTHFRNPRDLVPGSVMPPFPGSSTTPRNSTRWWPISRPRPRQELASRQRLREVRRTMTDYTYPSIYSSRTSVLPVSLAGAVFFLRPLASRTATWEEQRRAEVPHVRRRRQTNRTGPATMRHGGHDERLKSERPELHEYAGGWITERKGTEVPSFLKFAYIVIAARVHRLLLRLHERRSQPLRPRPAGAAVQRRHRRPHGFMYVVAALIVIFAHHRVRLRLQASLPRGITDATMAATACTDSTRSGRDRLLDRDGQVPGTPAPCTPTPAAT